ncbi:MAG TPA: sigma-70 family RNA polymerase sigma factor [Gemmatimonadales bacterium]
MPSPQSGAGRGPAPRALTRAREASLQARLIARDERALVELVELATPWLLGVAQGMLADRDDAEEVVQEAFTIAWRRVDLFDREQGRILPWLLRIVRNRAIDHLRGRRRRREKAQRLELWQPSDDRQAAQEPNEAAHPGWHVHESVHAALRALPEDQRQVVRLAYFEGLTQAEIAGELGIPIGTVKTRLRLAFDKLRVGLASIRDWVL